MPQLEGEESIRGIKSFSLGEINTKPSGFTYSPGAEQKRIASFDNEGYKIPGYPVLIAKDYKCSFTWSQFNGQLTSLAESFDSEYATSIVFATTYQNRSFGFTASALVVDGQSLTFDPLGDSLSIGFVITDTASVEFG